MQKISALLLAALVLLSLASCSFDTSSPSDVDSNTAFVSSESSSFEQSSSDNTSSNQISSSNFQTSSVTYSEPSGPSNTTSNVSSSTETSSTATSSGRTPSENSSDISSNPPNNISSEKPELYSCYSALGKNQKIIYDELLAAGQRMDSAWIDITVSGTVSPRDVSLVFYSLETDHPELFWLPSQYYISTSSNKLMFLFVSEDSDSSPQSSTYLINRSQKETMTAELRAAVEEIKALVTSDDPYEIELKLHDILCERVTYSKEDSSEPMLWTAYGALVNGTAVCEGYARAYQLLLYEFGINSTLATGMASGEGHMWNIVNINGTNYHVDVTWDDRDDQKNPPFHAFFNLSDSQIRGTHNPHPDYALIKDSVFESGEAVSYNYNLPECKDESLNYFNVTGKVFSAGEEEALADYIIKTGGSVEFKYNKKEPDINSVNTLLKNKKSSLRVKSWIQKPAAPDVIILRVE